MLASATVIDVEAGTVAPRTLVIRGGSIDAVLTPGSAELPPAGARVLDCTGLYVLPGESVLTGTPACERAQVPLRSAPLRAAGWRRKRPQTAAGRHCPKHKLCLRPPAPAPYPLTAPAPDTTTAPASPSRPLRRARPRHRLHRQPPRAAVAAGEPGDRAGGGGARGHAAAGVHHSAGRRCALRVLGLRGRAISSACVITETVGSSALCVWTQWLGIPSLSGHERLDCPHCWYCRRR